MKCFIEGLTNYSILDIVNEEFFSEILIKYLSKSIKFNYLVDDIFKDYNYSLITQNVEERSKTFREILCNGSRGYILKMFALQFVLEEMKQNISRFVDVDYYRESLQKYLDCKVENDDEKYLQILRLNINANNTKLYNFKNLGTQNKFDIDYIKTEFDCSESSAINLSKSLIDLEFIKPQNNKFFVNQKLENLFPISFNEDFGEVQENIFNLKMTFLNLKDSIELLNLANKYKSEIIVNIQDNLKLVNQIFDNSICFEINENGKILIFENQKNHFMYNSKIYFLDFKLNYLINIILQALVSINIVLVLNKHNCNLFFPCFLIQKDYRDISNGKTNLRKIKILKKEIKILKKFANLFHLDFYSITFDLNLEKL